VRQLEVENRRLQRKLARAETIITLQKNHRARLERAPCRPETPGAAIVMVPREAWPFAFW
jgi:hypothetical protein